MKRNTRNRSPRFKARPQLERLEARVLLNADAQLLPPPPETLDGGDAGRQPAPQEQRSQDPPPPRQTSRTRSLDGTNNNRRNPEWGATDSELLRLSTIEYGDGAADPAGEDRASPRAISNLVAAQSESTLNERGLSDLLWQWGQFLDHDIDLTGPTAPVESLPIEVPAGDPFFDPLNTGTQTIDFDRSDYDHDTGDSPDNPRQQINAITAFIDGSNVYGSDEQRAAALRTFEGGRLKTSDGDLLPFNEQGLDNAGGPSSSLFLAGDVRANEQVGLTAMHTLWVREHNRIAEGIARRNPDLSDEQIYQQARSMVIAEMQAITYNEFLPALLGVDALPEYEGYDRSVNPGISNVFSTAAYRFGHSMLSSELLRLDGEGQVIEDGNLSLRDAFFNPVEIVDQGTDSLLRGLASQQAQEIDTRIVDDVRNFLFGPPGSGGFDLASLNIQRGRDHGLADYNQVRVDFGLEPVSSFSEITSDPQLQAALEAAYGDVNNVDAWVGGLAEDHVPGGSVGELFQTVIVDQFTRLRDGDRFWYQRNLSGSQLRRIDNTSFADVMRRNTGIRDIQANVFFVSDAQPADQPAADNGQLVPLPPPPGAGPGQAGPVQGPGRDAAQPAARNTPAPADAAPPAGQQRQQTPPAEERGRQRRRRDPFASAADELFGQLGAGIDPRL